MQNLQSTDCGCGVSRPPVSVKSIYHHLSEANAPLAMGYVPFQHWERPFDLDIALQVGTIFPSLHKPFCGKGGRCK